MKRELDLNAAFGAAQRAFKANAGAMIGGGLLAMLISVVSLGLLSPAMSVGYRRLALRALGGDSPRAGDVMAGLSCAWSALCLAVATGLLSVVVDLPSLIYQVAQGADAAPSAIGALLNLLGRLAGILLGILLYWSIFLMADGETSPGACLSQSAAVTSGNIWRLLWFSLVVGLLSMSGAFAAGIGLLVTLPLGVLMAGHGYYQFFGQREQSMNLYSDRPLS